MPPRRRPARGRFAVEELEPRFTPALTLSLNPATISEAGGPATATVTRTAPLTAALAVSLASSDLSEATVPGSVTIPAGQASASFPVAAVNDPWADGTQVVTLTATAAGGGTAVAVDTTFGAAGYRVVPQRYRLDPGYPDTAVAADGKILALGQPLGGGVGALSVTRLTPAGAVDTTFGIAGTAAATFPGYAENYVAPSAVLAQPDGKVVVVGTAYQGGTQSFSDWAAARFNADGTLDTTFATGGRYVREFTGANALVGDAALLPDGRIVLAGIVSGGGNNYALTRLTASGTLDTTFGTGGLTEFSPSPGGAGRPFALSVMADGRLVVAGDYASSTLTNLGMAVARFTAAGAPDTTFGGDGGQVIPLASFGSGYSYAAAHGLAVMGDGRVVLGGVVKAGAEFFGSAAAVRLTAAGELDPTFSGDGVFAQRLPNSLGDEVYDLHLMPDGGVVLAGSAGQSGGGSDEAMLARLTPAGGLDPAFSGDGLYNLPAGGPGVYKLLAVAPTQDGRLVALGGSGVHTDLLVTRLSLTDVPAAAALTVTDDDPSLTLTVAPAGFFEGAGLNAATGTVTRTGSTAQAVSLLLTTSDPTELTVQAGVTIPAGQASATFPVRAIDDTLLDGDQAVNVRAASAAGPAFAGTTPLGEVVRDAVVQADGKLVTLSSFYTGTSGNFYDLLVRRYLPDGTPDAGFGTNGRVQIDLNGGTDSPGGLAVQPDGKIVVGGNWSPSGGTTVGYGVTRLTPAGAVDTPFAGVGKLLLSAAATHRMNAVALQPDGRILLAGAYDTAPTAVGTYPAVVRLQANGGLDTGFGSNSLAFASAFPSGSEGVKVAVAPNGAVVLAVTRAGAGNGFGLARFTPAGAADATFGTGGAVTTDLPGTFDVARGLAVLGDGRIVAAGDATRPGTTSTKDLVLLRYTTAGAPDPTFGTGGLTVADIGGTGLNARAGNVIVLPDGRLLVGGLGTRAGVGLFAPDGAAIAGLFASGTAQVFQTVALAPDGSALVFGLNSNTDPVGQVARFTLPPGLVAGAGVTVLDDEPTLVLTVSPATFNEAGGASAATATLVRGGSLASAYTVTLSSSTPGRVTVPASATFAAGQSSLTFPVSAVNNALSDGDEDVLLSAVGSNNGNGQVTGTAAVRVTDDEAPPPPPTLALSLAGPLDEHAGPAAGTGTVTRTGGVLGQPLVVSLSSDRTGELTVPASVTIPAGLTSVTFPLTPVDEATQDGDQTVTVTASLPGAGTSITGAFTYRSYSPWLALVQAVAYQPDGKVLVASQAGGDFRVFRFTAFGNGGGSGFEVDGSWAATATDISGGSDLPQAIVVYPDGRVLVVGTGPYSGTTDLVLARYTSGGLLDPTFDGDGKLTLDLGTGFYNEAFDAALAPDGKIVLAVGVDRGAPTYIDLGAVRLNPDGSRDTTFGTSGLAATDFAGLSDRGYAVAVQPDGKVLVAGHPGGGNSVSTFGVARFTTAGALDTTFGTGGKVSLNLTGEFEGATDLLLRPDGRIVLAGRVGRAGSSPTVYDPALVQLTAAGALDTTFGVNGVRVQNDTAGTQVFAPVRAALQADGRVVALGTVGASRSAAYTRLMRFSPTGTQEHASTGPYSQSVGQDLAVSAGGDVAVAYAYNSSGTDGYLDRYYTAPTPAAGVTATATVVVRDNEPFAAAADGYATNVGVALTVPAATGVRANDPITRPIAPAAELVSAPTAGTVSLAADGSFTYTPPAGFSGLATFTYRVRDGAAVTNAATVSVRMNTRPVGVADGFSTDEDVPLTVSLLPPPPASLPLRFGFDEAGGPAVNGGALAATGTLVGAAARSAAAAIGRSAAGIDLTASAGGRVSAGDLDPLDALTAMTASVWVRLTATPQVGDVILQDWNPASSPYPPAGTLGWELTVTAASANGVTLGGRLLRSTGSSTQSQTVSVALPAAAVGGAVFLAFLVDPADNLGDPNGRAVELLYGTPTAALTSSGRAYTTVQFGGSNDAPLTLGGSAYGAVEQSPQAYYDELRVYDRALTRAELEQVRRTTVAQLGVLANDTDADGDTLTVSTWTQPANGSVSVNADGSFTYTPRRHFFGTDTFTYRASDGAAPSDPVTVTVTVRERNFAPVAVADGYTLDEDSVFSFDIPTSTVGEYRLAMQSEPGDYIGGGQNYSYTAATMVLTATGGLNFPRFTVSSGPDWWFLDFAGRDAQLLAPGFYPGARRASFRGPFTPGLDVGGNGRGSNTLTGEFTVLQAVADANGMVVRFAADFLQRSEGNPNAALRGQFRYNAVAGPQGLLFNDADPDFDALTAVLVAGPTNGTLLLNPDGTFRYTPSPDFHGTDTFTYRASDGRLSGPPTTVTLTVRPRPDVVGPPEVNGGAAQRSRVTQLALTFDASLDTALLAQAGAFTVRRLADGATVGTVAAAATVAGGQTRVVLTFAGANTEHGSLADGRWVVVANKDFVRTPAGVGLTADYTSPSFHRLFGDTDGDRDVDNGDFVRLRPVLGAPAFYRADLDWDGDGDIDNGDFVRFRPRLGTNLP